jgi:hypothetical protein
MSEQFETAPGPPDGLPLGTCTVLFASMQRQATLARVAVRLGARICAPTAALAQFAGCAGNVGRRGFRGPQQARGSLWDALVEHVESSSRGGRRRGPQKKKKRGKGSPVDSASSAAAAKKLLTFDTPTHVVAHTRDQGRTALIEFATQRKLALETRVPPNSRIQQLRRGATEDVDRPGPTFSAVHFVDAEWLPACARRSSYVNERGHELDVAPPVAERPGELARHGTWPESGAKRNEPDLPQPPAQQTSSPAPPGFKRQRTWPLTATGVGTVWSDDDDEEPGVSTRLYAESPVLSADDLSSATPPSLSLDRAITGVLDFDRAPKVNEGALRVMQGCVSCFCDILVRLTGLMILTFNGMTGRCGCSRRLDLWAVCGRF